MVFLYKFPHNQNQEQKSRGLETTSSPTEILGQWLPALWRVDGTHPSGLLQGNQQKTIGKPWENGALIGFYGIYPLVMTNSLPLKMAIETVDLPIENAECP